MLEQRRKSGPEKDLRSQLEGTRFVIDGPIFFDLINATVCHICKNKIVNKITSAHANAGILNFSVRCSNCSLKTKQSTVSLPDNSQESWLNHQAISILLRPRNTHGQVAQELRGMLGVKILSSTAHYKRQNAFQSPILKLLDVVLQEQRTAFKKAVAADPSLRYAAIAIGGDGGWSHPRNARQFAYLMKLMGKDIGKLDNITIIAILKAFDTVRNGKVTSPGNTTTSSKGMEAEAFLQALQVLYDEGIFDIVQYIVTDQDSSTAKLLREFKEKHPSMEKVIILNDFGHRIKNFIKLLMAILGTGRNVVGLPACIKHFIYRIRHRAREESKGTASDGQRWIFSMLTSVACR